MVQRSIARSESTFNMNPSETGNLERNCALAMGCIIKDKRVKHYQYIDIEAVQALHWTVCQLSLDEFDVPQSDENLLCWECMNSKN
jgi:hypothetical protein